MRYSEIICEDYHKSLDSQDAYIQSLLDRIKNRRKSRFGPTLLDYISTHGGLNDRGGELTAMDLDLWHRRQPFMRKIIRDDGRTVGDMAVNAWEEGYFPDHTEAPEPQELIDAIRSELAGKPLYSRYFNATDDLIDAVNSLEDLIDRHGIDVNKTSPDDIKNLWKQDEENFSEEIPFESYVRESTYYRGSRDEPELTKRSSLSFADDPDIASVYAAHPETQQYTDKSRVSRAQFDLKNPVDLSYTVNIDLNTALGQVGVLDASENIDDVISLLIELENMEDRGVPFHYKILGGKSWDELQSKLIRYKDKEDWDSFFLLLDNTMIDCYALCDTKTYARLAKEHGYDGIIHLDSFDAGAKVATKLLNKEKPNTHLTYRPFNDVKWG